jgi:hypothetical protein
MKTITTTIADKIRAKRAADKLWLEVLQSAVHAAYDVYYSLDELNDIQDTYGRVKATSKFDEGYSLFRVLESKLGQITFTMYNDKIVMSCKDIPDYTLNLA